MGTESNINEVAQSVSSLSLNKTSESWIWVPSLKTRMENLLETGFESDLTLLLGEERQALKVHKLILMSASSRFHEMLRKVPCHNLEPRVIEIDDINPRTFKMLIKHLYTGDSGADITDALGLLSIATEYQAEDLIAVCNVMLDSGITNEIALRLFQDAMQFENSKLIISSLDHICKNATAILNREEFQNLRLECLIEILKQDGLCVRSEMEVFDAVIKWGEAECLRQDLEPLESKDLRVVLNKVLAYVRFPNMEQAEFALNVATRSLLDDTELISLMISFMVPKNNRSKVHNGRFISESRSYVKLEVADEEISNKKTLEPCEEQTLEQHETWQSPLPILTGERHRLARGKYEPQYAMSAQQSKQEILLFKVNKTLWLTGFKVCPFIHIHWKPIYNWQFVDLTCNYLLSKTGSTGLQDKEILRGQNVAFIDQISLCYPILLQENETYKLHIHCKGFVSRCSIFSKEEVIFAIESIEIKIQGGCEAVQTFTTTNKTGDDNEKIIFVFSREPEDTMPIEAGLISQFIFQLE